MSCISLKFASIEKTVCCVAHGPARLSDAREKSDKKMLGFPTVAALPASYDDIKFSGNAATRPMFHACRACFMKTKANPADACKNASANEVPIAFSFRECLTKDKGEQP